MIANGDNGLHGVNVPNPVAQDLKVQEERRKELPMLLGHALMQRFPEVMRSTFLHGGGTPWGRASPLGMFFSDFDWLKLGQNLVPGTQTNILPS